MSSNLANTAAPPNQLVNSTVPGKSSPRFLIVALAASFCLHIFLIAIGSQLSYQAPLPKTEHLIEVTLAKTESKKSTVVAAPRPIHPTQIADQPAHNTTHFTAPKPLVETKPQPRIEPVSPKVSVPIKPSTLIKQPIADHPATEDTRHNASVPTAPGQQHSKHSRIAERPPDESYRVPDHFTSPATILHNQSLTSGTGAGRNHETMELATGDDHNNDLQGNHNRSRNGLHYGGHAAGGQPFSTDEPSAIENPTDGDSSGGANRAAPGHRSSSDSTDEHDSSAGSEDADTTSSAGFKHNGSLPDNRSQDNGSVSTTSIQSHKHTNDDEAGANQTDTDQQSPSSERGSKKHHQRVADNPFGDLVRPADKLPRNRQANSQGSSPQQNLKRTKARLLSSPRPDYPETARRQGLEGVVYLLLQVNEQGRVDDVQITQSSGHDSLDEAAVDVARNWKFAPAREGNTPVPTQVAIPVRFRLE